MFDELKHLAARHLARRSPRQRAAFQAALDKWNAAAALVRSRRLEARHPWDATYCLRQDMEWALANGNIVDARRFARVL
jgi:hypothetical protein